MAKHKKPTVNRKSNDAENKIAIPMKSNRRIRNPPQNTNQLNPSANKRTTRFLTINDLEKLLTERIHRPITKRQSLDENYNAIHFHSTRSAILVIDNPTTT